MAVGRSSAFQSLAVMLSRVGAGGLNFVLFAVAARALGTDGFGVFSIVFSAVMLLGMAGTLGQQAFLVKEVPRARVGGSLALERGAYRYAAFVTSAGGVITAGILLGWLHLRVTGLSWPAMAAGASMVCLYAISQMTMGALRVEGYTVLGLFTRDFLWRLCSVIALLSAVFTATDGASMQPSTAIAVMAVALLPIVALHILVLRRAWRGRWAAVKPEYRWDSWVRLSAGLAVVGVISGADLYLFTLMVGRILSPVEAGAIFAAMKCIDLILLFLMATALVTGPELSTLVAQGNPEHIQRRSNAILLMQGIPAIGASLSLIALAPAVLSLFDAAYVGYAPTLRLLCIGMVFNALAGATNLMLQLTGLHWQQVWFQVGSLVVAMALTPWFVRHFGPIGVAWCFMIRQVLWNGMAIVALRRRVGVDPSILAFVAQRGQAARLAWRDFLEDVGLLWRRKVGRDVRSHA